ncbi:MAG: hypothetical protein FWD60_04635 [Candidatus Azobacteroides sp.]|nr:hypothetical protein [Candidatus Azobacteroides sp.]
MNSQQLQLVTYEQAKRLKELGFDWKTDYRFTNGHENLLHNLSFNNHNSDRLDISVPTVPLALIFIESKFSMFGYVQPDFPNQVNKRIAGITFKTEWIKFIDSGKYNEAFDTTEEAQSAVLDELLTLIEKENENI